MFLTDKLKYTMTTGSSKVINIWKPSLMLFTIMLRLFENLLHMLVFNGYKIHESRGKFKKKTLK